MRASRIIILGVLWFGANAAPAQMQVLKRSDVVFMFPAARQTCDDYAATFLAWGGDPTPQ